MTVWEIQGWFGDLEWSEALFAAETDANDECERLWKERRSEFAPEYVQGMCKFAVVDREVITASKHAKGVKP